MAKRTALETTILGLHVCWACCNPSIFLQPLAYTVLKSNFTFQTTNVFDFFRGIITKFEFVKQKYLI